MIWLLLLQAWAEVEVPPKPAPDPEAGERFYGWHCLPCHGPEGRGDGPQAARLGLKPRDLTRGLFKLKSSPAGETAFDDDLYRTLTAGLPVSYMPSFRESLDPNDRWAVIAFVRTLRREEPAKTRIEIPREAGDARRGGELFKTACLACHGAKDLSRGPAEFLGGAARTDVFRALTTGVESSPMPSFASLPVKDRVDLAEYVTTLYRPVPAGERLFFRSGCVACHTVGKGKHLGPDLKGVGARRSLDWLRSWLKDPEGMVRKDPDARKLFAEFRTVMPDPKLGEGDVDALSRWLSELH